MCIFYCYFRVFNLSGSCPFLSHGMQIDMQKVGGEWWFKNAFGHVRVDGWQARLTHSSFQAMYGVSSVSPNVWNQNVWYVFRSPLSNLSKKKKKKHRSGRTVRKGFSEIVHGDSSCSYKLDNLALDVDVPKVIHLNRTCVIHLTRRGIGVVTHILWLGLNLPLRLSLVSITDWLRWNCSC